MNKYSIIILVLIVIVIALIVGVVAIMPNMSKHDTKLTFISNTTLIEGDSINIKLTDANGTTIANQSISIMINDKNYSVTTNEEGIGILKLEQGAGKYVVTTSYAGNDKYSSSNSTQQLTIEARPIVSSSSSSNDAYNRDYNPNMPGVQNMYRAY